MQYRQEIDGLRAVAVISVILCHAKLPYFSGGYIGVDVFFVISGYLITSIIYNDLEKNKFSFINFYERRARRILPALFILILATLPFAYYWMLPDELKNFGESVVATILFSNNVLLSMTSGYWDLSSQFKPLLHTWSLGVEEQYYLAFPVLLVVWHKLFGNKSILIELLILIVGSIIFSILFRDSPHGANYYMLPSRAWELLIGSFVSFYIRYESDLIKGKSILNLISLLGLVLILGSVRYFDASTPTPGLWTLLPTIGSALIILYAVEGTLVNRVLSVRPVVFLGKISYSAYLWHWPLLSFAMIYSKNSPNILTNLLLCTISIFIAALSYKYVETPFRNKQRISRKIIFTYSTVFSIFLLTPGFYLWRSYGDINRIYPNISKNDINKNKYNMRVFKYDKKEFSSHNKTHVLVVGNSFARDFVNMMLETLNTKNTEIIYRNDLSMCLNRPKDKAIFQLYHDANIIVYSVNGNVVKTYDKCLESNITYAKQSNKHLFYVGPKLFGSNIDWITHLSRRNMANQYNEILPSTLHDEKLFLKTIPSSYRISILQAIRKGDRIPITDANGVLLSADRRHLTKYGAIYVGKRVFKTGDFASIISKIHG